MVTVVIKQNINTQNKSMTAAAPYSEGDGLPSGLLLTSSSSLLLLSVLSQFHSLVCNSESLCGKTSLWTSPLSQQVFVEPERCIRSCSRWRGALTSLVNEIQSAQRVAAVREPDVEEITCLNGPLKRNMMRTCCLNQSHWWSMARQSLSTEILHHIPLTSRGQAWHSSLSF